MQAGDKVFSAFASVNSIGDARCFVQPMDVLTVVDGTPVFAQNGRVITTPFCGETFATEAEAWGHCATELGRFREAIDAALAEATAKAAAGRVGEAVPA